MPNSKSTFSCGIFKRDLQVINREQRLARERLIDLEEINIIERKSRQVEDAGDGEARRGRHP